MKAHQPIGIATLGIPTRGRPDMLRRLLSGLAASCLASGRSPELVVVSTSGQGPAPDDDRGIVEEARARHPGPTGFVGPAELGRFAAALARESGAEPALARFALMGEPGLAITTGGSRNALLLHAAGTPHLQMDDDTLPLALETPDLGRSPVLASRPDPTEFRFTLDDPPEESFAPIDPLGLHERLLGQSADAPPANFPGRAMADRGLLRRASLGGKVLGTMTGVAGHSGMGSPAQLLMLEGASRERLLTSEAIYRRAVSSGRLARSVPAPTLGDPALCMALSLGLDGREVLPPFPPIGRAQDAAFGMAMRHCFPAALMGFLPAALAHRPPGRPPADPDWGLAARPRLGQVLVSLIAGAPAGAGGSNPASRLVALGGWLEEFGALPPADFEALMLARLRIGWDNRIIRLESLLRESGGSPRYWAADAEKFLGALRSLRAAPSLPAPPDFPADPVIPAIRRVVSRYGAMLTAWPALTDAAKRLRARGAGLVG